MSTRSRGAAGAGARPARQLNGELRCGVKPWMLLAAGVAGLIGAAQGATFRWVGAISTNWSDGANWTPANPPNDGSADMVFSNFAGSGSINTGAIWPDINSLTIAGSNDADCCLIQLSGNPITIRSGRLLKPINSGGDACRIDCDLRFPANAAFGLPGNNGGNALDLYGTVWESGGARDLTKYGVGILRLYGTNALRGTLTVNGTSGTDNLLVHHNDGRIASAGRLILNSSLLTIYQDDHAKNRIPDSAPIELNGGSLRFVPQIGSGNRGEDAGPATVRSGYSTLANEGGNATVRDFTLASLARDGTLRGLLHVYRGSTVNRVRLADDNSVTNALRGGGGAAGSKTMSILPWGSGTDVSGTLRTLLTCTAAEGLRRLTVDECYSPADGASAIDTAAAANGGNPCVNVVSTSNQVLTAECAINAFQGNTGTQGQSIDSDVPGTTRRLTVHSGRIMSGNLTITTNILLAFPAEAVLQNTSGARGLTIYAGMIGTNGLTYATDSSALKLCGGAANTLTGPYTAGAGSLEVSASESIPDSVPVRVHEDAVLRVLSGMTETIAALRGNGAVDCNSGANGGRLVVGSRTGATTLRRLVLNGGEIGPGDYQPGVMEILVGAGLFLATNGTVRIAIAGADVARAAAPKNVLGRDDTSHDRIHVTGTGGTNIVIGAALDLAVNLSGYPPADGEQWVVLSSDPGMIVPGPVTSTGCAGVRAILTSGAAANYRWQANLWDSDGDGDNDAVVLRCLAPNWRGMAVLLR